MAKKSPADTPADEPLIRPFADWLREQSGGTTHDELSDALHDLTTRVTDTGKKGVLQLTISVAPMKGAEEGVLIVSDQIKLKLPEHERKSSIFYSHDGNLQRTDPNQLAFDSLRDVSVEADPVTGELKEVSS